MAMLRRDEPLNELFRRHQSLVAAWWYRCDELRVRQARPRDAPEIDMLDDDPSRYRRLL